MSSGEGMAFARAVRLTACQDLQSCETGVMMTPHTFSRNAMSL